MNKEALDTPVALTAMSEPAPQLATLSRAAIVRSKTNPRTHFDESYIKELGGSIRDHGILQPILVRPLPASRLQDTFEDTPKGAPRPTHEIVCGECRWRGAGLVGIESMPVLIRHLDDLQVLQVQLVENLKRKDLHPLEEAEGFERLVDQHKLAPADIAARIGKSESYVYKSMTLLKLTTECRQELYAGKLSQSTALLVARAPAYLQTQIAKDIMRPQGEDQEPMSYRQAVRYIHQHYMLQLANAVFDIKDANLVVKAGSCITCTKNTGCNSDMFGDVKGGDACTDTKCFDAKKVAHFAIVTKAAAAKGQKVIQGKEAKELVAYEGATPKGYQLLDQQQYINGSYTSLRKAMGKDGPTPVMIVDPFSKLPVEALPVDVANKVIKQADAAAKAAKKNKAPTAQDLETQFEQKWQERAIEQIHGSIMAGKTQGITVAIARQIAIYYSVPLYGEAANRFARLFDVSAAKVATSAGIEAFLNECPDSLVGPALLVLMAEADFEDGSNARNGCVAKLIADDAGVDFKAIQAQVKADMKEAAVQHASAEPAPKSGKAKPAHKGKTTAADAQAGISQALKQADACEAAIGARAKVQAGKSTGKEGVLGPFMGTTWKITFNDGSTGRVERADFNVIAPPADQVSHAAWPFPTVAKSGKAVGVAA